MMTDKKPSSSYLSLSFSFVAYLICLNYVFLYVFLPMGVACCADAVVDENDKMNYNLILTMNDKNLGLLVFLFLFISLHI